MLLRQQGTKGGRYCRNNHRQDLVTVGRYYPHQVTGKLARMNGQRAADGEAGTCSWQKTLAIPAANQLRRRSRWHAERVLPGSRRQTTRPTQTTFRSKQDLTSARQLGAVATVSSTFGLHKCVKPVDYLGIVLLRRDLVLSGLHACRQFPLFIAGIHGEQTSACPGWCHYQASPI